MSEIRDFVLRNAFKVLFVVVVVGLFFYILAPFAISIVIGGILAMALGPVVSYVQARGLKRGSALALTIFLLAVLVLGPVVGFFVRGSRVITNYTKHADFEQMTLKAKQSAHGFMDRLSGLHGLDSETGLEKIDAMIGSIVGFITGVFGAFVAQLPEMFMLSFITLFAAYFFLREEDTIRSYFDKYSYFTPESSERFVRLLKTSCREVFVANILTGLLQATVVSIGALVFGVGDFFMVFFITFVASFIPIVGAGPVAAVLGLMCLTDGRTGSGIGMFVVAGVAGISDNVIRPYLASLGEVAVNPFVGLLAVIGGVIMLGLPGLFIGPLVASLCFGAVPIIIEELMPKDRRRSDLPGSQQKIIP
jgi:predicted PurR-regulated permease PerM